MRKLLEPWRTAGHIQIIFVTHTWGVLYSGCQDQYKTWFVSEKVKCHYLRRKILATQVSKPTSRMLTARASLLERGPDLLLGLTEVDWRAGLHSRFDGLAKVNYWNKGEEPYFDFITVLLGIYKRMRLLCVCVGGGCEGAGALKRKPSNVCNQ